MKTDRGAAAVDEAAGPSSRAKPREDRGSAAVDEARQDRWRSQGSGARAAEWRKRSGDGGAAVAGPLSAGGGDGGGGDGVGGDGEGGASEAEQPGLRRRRGGGRAGEADGEARVAEPG